MQIELFSFGFGVVFTLAIVIILEAVWGKLFGNRKLRELERQVKRLTKVVQKKDELIKKSLQSIQKEEKNDKEQHE
ncbi:MAG: hypothetical protein U5R06_24175 [candidate division KSB1 bacterium]|nr:hypothetical protein [candidate division KSB1 bacterium]